MFGKSNRIRFADSKQRELEDKPDISNKEVLWGVPSFFSNLKDEIVIQSSR